MPEHDAILTRIRALAASDQFRVTQHAQQEMTAESINLDDVLHAIQTSNLLEHYPEHKRGACCLLHGLDAADRNLHIVCTTDNPTLTLLRSTCPCRRNG